MDPVTTGAPPPALLPLPSPSSPETRSSPRDTLAARIQQAFEDATPSPAPEPAPDGDRVTIGSDGETPGGPRALFDMAALRAMLKAVRQPPGRALGLAGEANGASPRRTPFSFPATFGSVVSAARSGGLGALFQSLDESLEQLMAYDPEQGERLAVLLRVLAALNPDGAERMLETIHQTMARFNGAAAAMPTPGAPMPATADQAPAETTTTQVLHFELDLEITTSSSLESAVVELREQGIEVQATRVETTQSFRLHVEFTGVRQETRKSDPLVLDLGGDGVHLTGVADGADFDINADGRTDRTAFVQGDDAFLALDRNGNGRIDDGSELFGDQHGALNGFEELARFDDNRDGRIDRSDAIFDSLRLLHGSREGQEAARLSTLLEHGIESFDLRYTAGQTRDDAHGNTLAERSAYQRSDGSRGALVDAWVGYAG